MWAGLGSAVITTILYCHSRMEFDALIEGNEFSIPAQEIKRASRHDQRLVLMVIRRLQSAAVTSIAGGSPRRNPQSGPQTNPYSTQ